MPSSEPTDGKVRCVHCVPAPICNHCVHCEWRKGEGVIESMCMATGGPVPVDAYIDRKCPNWKLKDMAVSREDAEIAAASVREKPSFKWLVTRAGDKSRSCRNCRHCEQELGTGIHKCCAGRIAETTFADGMCLRWEPIEANGDGSGCGEETMEETEMIDSLRSVFSLAAESDSAPLGFIERTQPMESRLYIYDVIDPKASNGYAWQLTERLNSGWELVEFRSAAALIRKRASLEEIDAWKRSIQDAVNKRARLS